MEEFIKPKVEAREAPDKMKRGMYDNEKFTRASDILSDLVTETARLRAEAYGDSREHEIIYYKAIPQVIFELMHTFPDAMGKAVCEGFMESIENKKE
jgi:hypothetical protein